MASYESLDDWIATMYALCEKHDVNTSNFSSSLVPVWAEVFNGWDVGEPSDELIRGIFIGVGCLANALESPQAGRFASVMLMSLISFDVNGVSALVDEINEVFDD